MRTAPRHYLLIVFAPLAVLVSVCALLNVWVDPLKTLRDQRLTTRPYALPDLLDELKLPTVSEADIDAFLLGTSRTRRGITARKVPEIINLGVDGATERMIDNLLVGLLQNSTRPHVYLVDTLGGLDGVNEALEGRLLHHLLSGGTTKQSLRQILGKIRIRYFAYSPRPIENGNPGLDQPVLEFLRNSLTVLPATQVSIEQRIERLRELPVPHNALVVFYEGPHSPLSRSDPIISNALRQRSTLWRQVLQEHDTAKPSNPDVLSVQVGQPRVKVIYRSYATPDEWGEHTASEMWTETNWWDVAHFKPIVGERLLERFKTLAE
jgi:hypothetical protein